jgi:proteasome alpha subunit
VLFVAENHSPALHKVSEIYDRIGFAAAGRYNEFENLRTAGIRLADVRGFSYDRKDVTGRWLANAYAQTIGSIFSEHQKPFEVEICVAEVGPPRPPRPTAGGPTGDSPTGDGGPGTGDQLYRISYDGSIVEERKFVVMGGVNEPVITALNASFRAGWDLSTALRSAVSALGSTGDNPPRDLLPTQLEVAVLDRSALGRTFRRIQAPLLATLLTAPSPSATAGESVPEPDPTGPEES